MFFLLIKIYECEIKQPTANRVKLRFSFKIFVHTKPTSLNCFISILVLVSTVWFNYIWIILPCFTVGARVVEKLSGPVRKECMNFVISKTKEKLRLKKKRQNDEE